MRQVRIRVNPSRPMRPGRRFPMPPSSTSVRVRARVSRTGMAPSGAEQTKIFLAGDAEAEFAPAASGNSAAREAVEEQQK